MGCPRNAINPPFGTNPAPASTLLVLPLLRIHLCNQLGLLILNRLINLRSLGRLIPMHLGRQRGILLCSFVFGG